MNNLRVWDIRYSVPPTETVKWPVYHSAIVLADTALEALNKVITKHPEVTVHTCCGKQVQLITEIIE